MILKFNLNYDLIYNVKNVNKIKIKMKMHIKIENFINEKYLKRYYEKQHETQFQRIHYSKKLLIK